MNVVNKQILRLSWPAIATNITTPLLSLIDVAIVGHLQDGGLIGAVAVGGTLFNILYWMFAFLRMGTSGLTAQALGAADVREQRYMLIRGLMIALAGGILLPVVAQFVGFEAIRLIDGSGEVQEMAWKYFRIAIIGAPGVLTSYVVSGWLLGMQRSRPIMWIALSTNLLNITLSLLFVYVFKLGITGVAMGTATAQLTGAVIGLCVAKAIYRQTELSASLSSESYLSSSQQKLMDARRWKSMFKINTDIFLRTVCLASVTLWFTHAGATIGADVLSANSLLLQLFLVFSYFMDGFAFGGEAMAGKYYGARDFRLLRITVRSLFRWGIATSLIFTVLYFILGKTFLAIFSDNTTILAIADDYRFWIVLVPLMGFSAFTWDGIMIGLTRTRYLLVSMAVAMIVFFGILFTGHSIENIPFDSNHLLWLAFIVYLGVRGIILALLYRNFMRKVDSNVNI